MTDGRNFSSCYTYLQGFLSPPVGPLTVCLDFVNENKKENKKKKQTQQRGHSRLLHLQWPLITNVIEASAYKLARLQYDRFGRAVNEAPFSARCRKPCD